MKAGLIVFYSKSTRPSGSVNAIDGGSSTLCRCLRCSRRITVSHHVIHLSSKFLLHLLSTIVLTWSISPDIILPEMVEVGFSFTSVLQSSMLSIMALSSELIMGTSTILNLPSMDGSGTGTLTRICLMTSMSVSSLASMMNFFLPPRGMARVCKT